MSIKSHAIRGFKWSSVSTATLAFSALLKVSVLTRYLEKSDFGLMAIIMFVLGFMDIFMDMGLSISILHKQEISKKEYSSLYWLNLVFSLVLFALVILVTPLVSGFYSEPELNDLLPLMSMAIIFSALGRQFKTVFQKHLRFKLIAIVEIASAVISLVTAIILAINQFGVYSLVYSALLKYMLENIVFLILGLFEGGIMIRLNFEETKPFLKIGIYQVGGQMIAYFNKNIDVMLIGKFLGSEILGGYSLAKQLVSRPSRLINPILTKVAAPLLSTIQKQKDKLSFNFLKLVNIVATISFPVYLLIAIFAPTIVHILYGGGFQDIVLLVRILCVYMFFQSLHIPFTSLVIATGRTDLGFYWGIITLSVMPVALILGSQYSVEWVGISITLAMMLLFVPSWWFLVKKLLGVRLSTYLYWIIPNFRFKYNNNYLAGEEEEKLQTNKTGTIVSQHLKEE